MTGTVSTISHQKPIQVESMYKETIIVNLPHRTEKHLARIVYVIPLYLVAEGESTEECSGGNNIADLQADIYCRTKALPRAKNNTFEQLSHSVDPPPKVRDSLPISGFNAYCNVPDRNFDLLFKRDQKTPSKSKEEDFLIDSIFDQSRLNERFEDHVKSHWTLGHDKTAYERRQPWDDVYRDIETRQSCLRAQTNEFIEALKEIKI